MSDQDSIEPACPPEIRHYWVARATYAGGDIENITTDVEQLENLLRINRRAVEEQMDRADGYGAPPPYGILGIYRTREEACAALEWIVAWRRGS